MSVCVKQNTLKTGGFHFEKMILKTVRGLFCIPATDMPGEGNGALGYGGLP